MTKSIFLSIIFHSIMIVLTALSLPFMMRAPIDLPPILSVDLIQITDSTSIPYAAKATEILEKVKKEEEKRLVAIIIIGFRVVLVRSLETNHYEKNEKTMVFSAKSMMKKHSKKLLFLLLTLQ